MRFNMADAYAASPIYWLPCRQRVICRIVYRVKFKGTVLHQFSIQPSVRRMIQILKKDTKQISLLFYRLRAYADLQYIHFHSLLFTVAFISNAL